MDADETRIKPVAAVYDRRGGRDGKKRQTFLAAAQAAANHAKPTQHRRCALFVARQSKMKASSVGATSAAEAAAPTELMTLGDGLLQRFRADGAGLHGKALCF